MVPDPLVGAPLLDTLPLGLAAPVQAALVQPAVGHHRVEEDGVAAHGLHPRAAVAVLVVAVPRVVLAALRVERAREEGLTPMPLLDRLEVPEDGGQPVAPAVLDAREHVRLLVVVVRVEEVPVRAVLLARHVPHHLYVLAQRVRQARQVVRALLERADLRRAVALHEGLRRGAHVLRGAAAVHHGEAARLHARLGVPLDEVALLLGQEAIEHEHIRAQRDGRHLDNLVSAGGAVCHRDGHARLVAYPHARPDELAARVQVEHRAAAEVVQVLAALDRVAHRREEPPRVGRELVVGRRDHRVHPLELEVEQLVLEPAEQRVDQIALRLCCHVQLPRAALDGARRIAGAVVQRHGEAGRRDAVDADGMEAGPRHGYCHELLLLLQAAVVVPRQRGPLQRLALLRVRLELRLGLGHAEDVALDLGRLLLLRRPCERRPGGLRQGGHVPLEPEHHDQGTEAAAHEHWQACRTLARLPLLRHLGRKHALLLLLLLAVALLLLSRPVVQA
mmetsp:Transcript_3503/g.8772  ORF Transcript_3503/g.8772 Transcript_3503/m.8772 type:complete len:504 (+) Transcript_3503:360-1871(+)